MADYDVEFDVQFDDYDWENMPVPSRRGPWTWLHEWKFCGSGKIEDGFFDTILKEGEKRERVHALLDRENISDTQTEEGIEDYVIFFWERRSMMKKAPQLEEKHENTRKIETKIVSPKKLRKHKFPTQKMEEKGVLDELCNDVLSEILSFFSMKERVTTFSLVCKDFNSICSSTRFWRVFSVENGNDAFVSLVCFDSLRGLQEYTLYHDGYYSPYAPGKRTDTYNPHMFYECRLSKSILGKYPVEELWLTHAKDAGLKRIFEIHVKSLKTVILNKYEQEKYAKEIKKTNPQVTIRWLEDVYQEADTSYLIVHFFGRGLVIPIEIPHFDITGSELCAILCKKVQSLAQKNWQFGMKNIFFRDRWLKETKMISEYGMKSGNECFFYYRYWPSLASSRKQRRIRNFESDDY